MFNMTENNLMMVANDLGYGFLKSQINDKKYKIPSVIAAKQTYLNPNADKLTDKYMDDFMNRMDVSISSASVQRTGRFLVGKAASQASARTQTFNIYSGNGKADDDLSVILTLSLIAGAKVQEVYKNNGNIFDPISVNVIMATELPISEGRDSKKSTAYEKKYLDHKHIVTFNNFENPITVSINFLMVRSFLEGETASLALANASQGLKGFDVLDTLKKEVANDYQANYPDRAKKYGVEEILEAQNIFVMDIGERTSDLVTTSNGAANPEASDSIDLGFGTALEKTRQEARIKGLGQFSSRYDLKEYLSRDLIGANKEKQDAINILLTEQLQELSNGILDAASDILNLTANSMDVIYVLGGGSIPMAQHSNLRNELNDLLQSLNATSPVVWIDKDHAQWVNEIGLSIVLSEMKYQAKESGLIA